MNQIQLYLNNQLADLSDDSPIALTFQINNLAEVKNQQGNTSNQFKLPLTARNRQILGFPDEVAFTTGLPYDNYEARIVQDGLEILPYGIAQLNLIEQDTASITVLSGNVDFFDAIDARIYDMGDETTDIGRLNAFAPYEHTWDLTTVTRSQINTEGFIWPVVDYGKIAVDFNNSPHIDVRYLRPGFFLKTAINLFAQTAGYKIDPQSFLLQQPMYDKLIIQFANDSFEHGGNTQNKPDEYGVTAFVSLNKTVQHLTVSDGNGTLPFNNITTDAHQQFDGTTFRSKQIATVSVAVTLPRFRFQGRVTGYPANVDIIIYKHGPAGDEQLSTLNYSFLNWTRVSGSGGNIYGYEEFEPKSLSVDTDLVIGDEISIRYLFAGNTHASFVLYSGSSLTIKSKNINVLYGQQVQCERIFPDITQKDLLKDTLQRFGIICQTNNTTRTVTFSSFRDIVNNMPAALNWTKKCLDQGKTVSFQLGNYAQVNTMTYKADDAVLPANFGNAQINVKDKTLPLTTALFESQFAPTLNRTYIGGSIAQILKVDTAQDINEVDFSISTQPRILIDQKLDLREVSGSAAITFTDGDSQATINDVISVPYFYKPGGNFSLLWDDLRIAYFPELEKILQQTKKVVRYFLLTPRDILELDLLMPVYLEQDSCYYYINKIESWRSGQPTRVELVKLG